MSVENEFRQFELVAEQIYPASRLVQAWTLTGGVSAQVTALEIALPDGSLRKVVVRRYGERDRAGDAQIAAHEFKLLQFVQAAGVPVAAPLFFDQAGRIFPTPFIVIEFVEGTTDFDPANLAGCMAQMAQSLAHLHRVDVSNIDLTFLPNITGRTVAKLAQKPLHLDESLQESRIRAALERFWPLPAANPTALLHGDYWPGNILWQGDRLAAILDWEDAKLGDPLADLANTRLEILWGYGPEAMELFTRQYLANMPLATTDLPYWELAAALRPAGRLGEWAGSPEKEKVMRERHALFVAGAFERINRL